MARPRKRERTSRDYTSDHVWGLVEEMMKGDPNATIVLDDVIEEGVKSKTTKFVKITRRAYKRFGKQYPAVVTPNHYAAITPGSSIVLFGVKRVYPKAGEPELKGYIRRFAIGDTAEYDSYNLVYLGPITQITEKRVTIQKGNRSEKKAVLDIETFDTKNYDLDVEEVLRRNADTMQHI